MTLLSTQNTPGVDSGVVLDDHERRIIQEAVEGDQRIPDNQNTIQFKQMLSELTKPVYVMGKEDPIDKTVYIYQNGTYYRLIKG